MAMEVVCGNCHGRLLVEHTGVVVACPHCGAHLQIGDPAPAASSEPLISSGLVADAPPPLFPPPSPANVPPQFAPAEQIPPPTSLTSIDPQLKNAVDALPEIILTPRAALNASVAGDSPPISSIGSDQSTQPVAENDAWMPEIDLAMPKAVAQEPPPRVASLESSTMILPGRHEIANAIENSRAAEKASVPTKPETTDIWSRERLEQELREQPPLFGEEPQFLKSSHLMPGPVDPDSPVRPTLILPDAHAATVEQPTLEAAQRAAEVLPEPKFEPRAAAGVSWYLFLMVASYASAVTLALIYLLWRGTPTLDLPDVVPEFNKNGKVTWRWINETPLPRDFRVKLGETKQYGNIKITPLKVTKSPVEFVHFADPKQVKSASTAPVLKLWVKFENVSNDQTFPALDEQLLYQRANDKQNMAQVKTNNYVCQQSERKREGKRVSVYELPINGEWLLKDQNLNSPIGPHQSWQTYIPTNDEDLSSLQGPLTWRLHFRKGYNPKSFRGVTTLVEVEFDSKDIQVES